MPQFAVNDVAQVRVVCYVQNQIGVNVLHYKCTSISGGSSNEASMAEDLSTLLAPLYKNILSAQAKFRGVGVRFWRPLPIGPEYAGVANDGVGLVAGDMMPKQVSGLLTLRTIQAGRTGRGRIYPPFPAEADNQVDSTPSAAYVVALAALGTSLIAPFTASQTTPAGTATFSLGLAGGTGAVNFLVDRYVARNRWATQRRRGDFGKTNLLPF